MAFLNTENKEGIPMISKENFCRAMRLRDKQFDTDNALELYFDTLYGLDRRSKHRLEVQNHAIEAFEIAMAAIFNVEPEVIKVTVGTEDEDCGPVEVLGADGKVLAINSYEMLYDYFVQRMEAAA